MKKYISTSDIAKKLGISPSTVSRALNDNYKISEKTRQLVKEYAKKVGYQKNLHAASLIQNSTNIIGLVVPSTTNYFLSRIVKGITSVLYDKGYELLIMQTNEDFNREMEILSFLRSIRVDAIIYAPAHSTHTFDHIEEIIRSNLPFINYDRLIKLDCPKVLCDDKYGAKAATQHLIDIGSKRIVHLGGPEHAMNAESRFEGYCNALKINGFSLDMKLVFRTEFSIMNPNTMAAIDRIFKLTPLPDAIFSANDELAIGCMKKARTLGLKIPADIAFVGYDDDTFCQFMHPTLSTVKNKIFDMGVHTAKKCLLAVNDPEIPIESLKLLPKLIIRGSSRKGTVLHYV